MLLPFLLAATVAAPPPELSTFVVPIRANLGAMLPEIEKQVPKVFADATKERGLDVRYRVERDPIRLQMVGAGLHVTTTMRYQIQACAPSPLGCVSCGVGQPMRRVAIALHSHFSWDARWLLRSVTKEQAPFFENRCRVSLLNVDVTDWKVRPVIVQQLRDTARSIDANVLKLTSFRRDAQQIWSSLQAPVELGPRTWLVLEPVEVALAPLTGSGLDVNTTLTLRARTRIVVGERPAVAAKPLPALRQAAAGTPAVRVPFEVEMPYAEAGRLMTEQFGNRTYKLRDRELAVETIRLLPGDGEKLTIEASIHLKGRYKGLVYLEGVPRYDAATGAIAIDGLEYSLKRSNPFIRLVDRFVHDDVRARLRESARFPIAAELARLQSELNRGLTRTLAPGASMRGSIDALTPSSVFAHPEGVVIRGVAVGRAEVAVR